MRPVDQTQFGAPEGNCFEACVGSLMEVPVAEVPPGRRAGGDGFWWEPIEVWLRRHGRTLLWWESGRGGVPPGYAIGSGPSPRGDWMHAVVYQDGQVVHDPHPSREGLAGERFWWVIAPLDPGMTHDPVFAAVHADLEARNRRGTANYGGPLVLHNGRDPLQEAYEEALDLSVYLRWALLERGGRP